MKIEFVNDLFDTDFFTNLKDFILDESFDDFYNRKLEENRDYSKGYTTFWLNSEYLDDSEMRVNITFPLTYNDFLEMYKIDGSCANIIDEHLFYIKFLMKKLFENKTKKHLENELFTIQLNKNILSTFFDNEICKKLYNSKVKDLMYLNIKILKSGKHCNKNFEIIYTRSLLLYVFEYIETYLETLLENISSDISSVIQSYTPETNMILLDKIPNLGKEIRKYSNYLKQDTKTIRTERLKAESGTRPKELTGYFPQTRNGLQNCIKKYEKMLNEYPEIKKLIKTFKKRIGTSEKTTPEEFVDKYKNPISRKKIKALKEYICKYLMEKNTISSYITLEDNQINEFDVQNNNEEITELCPIIMNYIDLLDENHMISFSQAVIFTLLEQSGNLGLFENCENKDETIKKFFNRKVLDEKLITDIERPKKYINREFITKYKTLFDF